MWKPFSNGTQFADWKENNCKRCTKGYDGDWHCDIEYALDVAYVTTGYVTDDIANRIGRTEEYLWICKEKEMNIINLTPHKVTVIVEGADKNPYVYEFPPSGQIARATVTQENIGVLVKNPLAPIPIVKTIIWEIEGLPEPAEDTLYIVSSIVAQAVAGKRDDVVAPDTGPTAYRDEEGRIVAVRRFQQW